HHDGTFLAQRPHPAATAPVPRRGGLHHDLELTVDRTGRQHPEAVASEHDRIDCTTLNAHLKPSTRSLDNRESRKASGVHEGTSTGSPITARSPLRDEDPPNRRFPEDIAAEQRCDYDA